ncbi:MAG: hypothetical protein U0R19_15665 [Bryobacteraceae bacterium]
MNLIETDIPQQHLSDTREHVPVEDVVVVKLTSVLHLRNSIRHESLLDKLMHRDGHSGEPVRRVDPRHELIRQFACLLFVQRRPLSQHAMLSDKDRITIAVWRRDAVGEIPPLSSLMNITLLVTSLPGH